MLHGRHAIDIFLQPGEYFVGDRRYRIRTLLGSCVSITLWHPHMRIGAMSHFLLGSRAVRAVSELDGRYGEEVMHLMLRELERAKVPLSDCQAKIFGGANMFPGQTRINIPHVGQKNGEAARALLQSHGIRVVSESLFGVGHRQIIFDVHSGDVWSRQIKPADNGWPKKQESA
jgi:chemotaxis protein CheD